MRPDLDVPPCAVALGIGRRVAEDVALAKVFDHAAELFAQFGGHRRKVGFTTGYFRQVLEKWFVDACSQTDREDGGTHFPSELNHIIDGVSAARACPGVVLVSTIGQYDNRATALDPLELLKCIPERVVKSRPAQRLVLVNGVERELTIRAHRVLDKRLIRERNHCEAVLGSDGLDEFPGRLADHFGAPGHAAAAVDEQADGDRIDRFLKRVYRLRNAVFEHIDVVGRDVHVSALAIRDPEFDLRPDWRRKRRPVAGTRACAEALGDVNGYRSPVPVFVLIARRIGNQIAAVLVVGALRRDGYEIDPTPWEERASAGSFGEFAKCPFTVERHTGHSSDGDGVDSDLLRLKLLERRLHVDGAVLVEAVGNQNHRPPTLDAM